MPIVATGQRNERLGRRLLLAGLLGLAVLLSHHLLMATERHARDMSMAGAHGVLARSVGHRPTMPAVVAGAHQPDDAPLPLPAWEECLAQYAILPVLLLLLALVEASRWLGRGVPLLPSLGGWAPALLHPPPPDGARRRAFLQVFLN